MSPNHRTTRLVILRGDDNVYFSFNGETIISHAQKQEEVNDSGNDITKVVIVDPVKFVVPRLLKFSTLVTDE